MARLPRPPPVTAPLETRWFGERGDGGTPVVVLLHDGLGSVSAWRDFPAKVAQGTGLPVFAYSRRGYGTSPRAGPGDVGPGFMHVGAQQELPDLLEREGIRHPLLVGHSDGASIAIIYAGTVGRSVARGCVLLAPHVFVEDCTLRSARAARHDFAHGGLRPRMARHHDDPDGAFYLWSESWLAPAFAGWNIESEAQGIRCPVAAVQGLDDPYGTIAQIERLRTALKKEPLLEVLSECGHAPHRDHETVVLRVIADLSKATLERTGQ